MTAMRTSWDNACAAAQGMTLKFYDSHADVLLLNVPNVVPDHYNVRRAACSHLPSGCSHMRAAAHR